VIGFVALCFPDRFIHHLYVRPDHADQGLGRSLLAAALRQTGGWASLKCHIQNTRARRFYQREGWTEAERGGEGKKAWVRYISPAIARPARLPRRNGG
jgi:GNAT superfamily N-acetyltransferase